MKITADGHIHTPFCPHGSRDPIRSYIEKALELGLTEISFTEHAPLPEAFTDPTPAKDSSMPRNALEDYLHTLRELQKEYEREIKINKGLEVDFIEGYEAETTALLNEYGPFLDDSILSVHFLNQQGQWYCLDYSPEMFKKLAAAAGSVEKLHEQYYQTVLLSIHTDLGNYKPKRIGHMSLVRKFQRQFPVNESFNEIIVSILHEIKRQSLQLDYNGAGAVKPGCLEPYPADWIVRQANALQIPLVYGSDAHTVSGLLQGSSSLLRDVNLRKPTFHGRS